MVCPDFYRLTANSIRNKSRRLSRDEGRPSALGRLGRGTKNQRMQNHHVILILDNRDSFTYNLVQLVETLGARAVVYRAEDLTIEKAAALQPTHLLLSPGPLRPSDHPMNAQLLAQFRERIPILGVCLGLQATNEFFGGTLRRDTPPLHGKTSAVWHDGDGIFRGVNNPSTMMRYHSLVIDKLGVGLRATAWTHDHAQIMAIAHESLPIVGVQFHPESFMSAEGATLVRNFLMDARGS